MILLRYGYLNDMLQERQLPLVPPILIGVGLAVALAAIFAIHPTTQPVPDNTSVAAKADRPAVIPDARVVRTIPISRLPAPTVVAPLVLPDPAPQSAAPPAPAEAPPAKVAQYIMPVAPPAHTDVCRKHGGYKEVRGRSWHCVYPGKR